MIVFKVFYPATGGARFDAAYYNATHTAGGAGLQVDWPCRRAGVSWSLAGDGGPAPYVAMAHLSFETSEALQASFPTGPRAAEVFGDIANFTTIQPLTQVSAPR